MSLFALGKYRAIVISIAFFIVFDAGVLILNFYIASQFAEDAVGVNLAGRQRTLSQRTVKAVMQIDNALATGGDINPPLIELKNAYQVFDDTLNAFVSGGTVAGADGRPVSLRRVETSTGNDILTHSVVAWRGYTEALRAILEFDGKAYDDHTATHVALSDAGDQLQSDLYHAVDFTSANNLALLGLMNDLTVHLENEASARVRRLRMIQATGICLALANFFLILFHFLRNLRCSDEALEHARQETDEILDTVKEGLFLLDADLSIGSQYSRMLTEIFRRNDLDGLNFRSLLKDIVPGKTLAVAVDFVELLFGDRVNENLVGDLNPLDEVEVYFEDGGGRFVTRFLGFDFRRVRVDGELSHLLVSVRDISDQVALAAELERSREHTEVQLGMLLDILHIDPEALTDFLLNSQKCMGNVNLILREPAREPAALKAKLEPIHREVHTMKGEAAVLGLSSVEGRAHEFEDMVSELSEMRKIGGDDFLQLAVKLDELLSHLDSVTELVGRLVEFRGAIAGPVAAAAGKREATAADARLPAQEPESLARLAQRIAETEGKLVAVESRGLALEQIPQPYRKAVRDMCVQFVRNGVFHGIETPDERRASDKAEGGRLLLSFTEREGGGYELGYRDDGRGLRLAVIRQAAVDKGFVPADQVDALDASQLMALVFRPGFSTSQAVTRDAGRGVGLDVVRHLVTKLNGQVRVASTEGKYTQFRVLLPALPDTAVAAA